MFTTCSLWGRAYFQETIYGISLLCVHIVYSRLVKWGITVHVRVRFSEFVNLNRVCANSMHTRVSQVNGLEGTIERLARGERIIVTVLPSSWIWHGPSFSFQLGFTSRSRLITRDVANLCCLASTGSLCYLLLTFHFSSTLYTPPEPR